MRRPPRRPPAQRRQRRPRWAPPGRYAASSDSQSFVGLVDDFDDQALRPIWTDRGGTPVTLSGSKLEMAPASAAAPTLVEAPRPFNLNERSVMWDWTFPAAFFLAANKAEGRLVRHGTSTPIAYVRAERWDSVSVFFYVQLGQTGSGYEVTDYFPTTGHLNYRWIRISAVPGVDGMVRIYRSADRYTWTQLLELTFPDPTVLEAVVFQIRSEVP